MGLQNEELTALWLIKAATGADRVFVFDHTVRKRVQGAADRDGGLRQPVARVHVDHTEKSGLQRVRDLIPDEAEGTLERQGLDYQSLAIHSRAAA